MPYASRATMILYGCQAALLADQVRPLAAVDAASNRFTLEGHGLALDDEVQFSARSGATLPAPLSASSVYYARPVSSSLFEVAATPGGAAVNITDAGAGVIGLVTSLDPVIDAEAEYQSRVFDRHVIGHEVPFTEPYPAEAVAITSRLTTAAVLRRTGRALTATIEKNEAIAVAEMKHIQERGLPLRDERATGPSNLARTATMTGGRGWTTTDDTIP